MDGVFLGIIGIILALGLILDWIRVGDCGLLLVPEEGLGWLDSGNAVFQGGKVENFVERNEREKGGYPGRASHVKEGNCGS